MAGTVTIFSGVFCELKQRNPVGNSALCYDRIWARASADNVFLFVIEQGCTASCCMSFGDILVGMTQAS